MTNSAPQRRPQPQQRRAPGPGQRAPGQQRVPQQRPQGMPPQGMPPGGPQGMPPQGMPPQGMPQGMPPQGMPQGMPPGGPQGIPPQGMPLQGMPPQGMPPQGMPPQGMPPQGIPPQGMPPGGPQQRKPQGGPQQRRSPGGPQQRRPQGAQPPRMPGQPAPAFPPGASSLQQNAMMLDPQRFQVAKMLSVVPGGPSNNNPQNGIVATDPTINPSPYGDMGTVSQPINPMIPPSPQLQQIGQGAVSGRKLNKIPYNLQQQPPAEAADQFETNRLNQKAAQSGIMPNSPMGAVGNPAPMPGASGMIPQQTPATMPLTAGTPNAQVPPQLPPGAMRQMPPQGMPPQGAPPQGSQQRNAPRAARGGGQGGLNLRNGRRG